MLKILFMGTPDFAEESLKAVHKAEHNILGVITNPDRPKGRGMKMLYTPVKEYAIENGIPVFQPERVKGNTELIQQIKKLNPDVICVVAYGKILPKEILEIPKKGCINVHASLLPKYRGAAPIQWSIINGDEETGISIMYMDEGMDTGDIILTEKVKIDENETTGMLWERLAKLGGKILVETLEKVEKGEAPRKKQEGKVVLAPMLNKEMAKINWEEKTAEEIKNLIRGLNPIMGAYGLLDDKKLKIWRADVIKKLNFFEQYTEFKGYENRFDDLEPGTIIYIDNQKGVYVKAKDEILLILEVQAENAKKMSITDFLRGNKIEVGQML